MHYPFDVQFELHIQRQVKSLAPTCGEERGTSPRVGGAGAGPPPAALILVNPQTGRVLGGGIIRAQERDAG